MKSIVNSQLTGKWYRIAHANSGFEMKFLEDIDVIMSLLDKEVQTLAFSATINGQLRHFISKYMQSKEIIEIGKKKESSVTITHNCVPLRGKTRLEGLLNLVSNINPYFCLIFFANSSHNFTAN